MSERKPTAAALRACKDGPTLSQADAGGKRFEECAVCQLALPWDRNMHFLAGFKISCPRRGVDE